MPNCLLKHFIKEREQYNDKNYLISTIAYHIAPILTAGKPSSVLTFNKHGRNVYELWEQNKFEIFKDSNICFCELKKTNSAVCVLFYIPENLIKTLKNECNMKFLKRFGYLEEMTLAQCLNLLENRLEKDYPHEIGIFLGIPCQDVESFIESNGKNYMFSGYWKVYHGLQQTLHTFRLYDMAKERAIHMISEAKMHNGIIDFTMNALMAS